MNKNIHLAQKGLKFIHSNQDKMGLEISDLYSRYNSLYNGSSIHTAYQKANLIYTKLDIFFEKQYLMIFNHFSSFFNALTEVVSHIDNICRFFNMATLETNKNNYLCPPFLGYSNCYLQGDELNINLHDKTLVV